jgi:hypothetical protein
MSREVIREEEGKVESCVKFGDMLCDFLILTPLNS